MRWILYLVVALVAIAGLAVVALLAAAVPMRRALRIAPAEAIRE